MEDFLHAQTSPGADARIVIGRWAVGMALPDGPGRVLWFVDSEGTAASPPGTVTVQLVKARDPQASESALEDFLHQSPKTLPSLYVTRHLPGQHADAYAAAIEAAGNALEAHRRARATRQADAFAWQFHLYRNLPDYVAHRLPDDWANALAGRPAVVCGAGPSLDLSIDALARAAEAGAVVFAADSAWRRLVARAIAVDFVVSVDIAKTPARCLPAGGMTHERVILAATSPPAWSTAAPDASRIYLSGPQPTLDWLANRGVARTAVDVCENCGATALGLARFLGCGPIYLFGLDLALDDADLARRHHADADATLYKESGFNAAQEFPRVPGNFAETVPTHALGDWRALDRRLAQWPANLVVAVTDRGARLSKVQAVRPEVFQSAAAYPNVGKTPGLRPLPVPASALLVTQQSIGTDLAAFGTHLSKLANQLQAADVLTIVQALRGLLTTAAYDRILGAYALKLFPHVLPPIDPNPAFWRAIVEEIAALGAAAVAAGDSLCKQWK